MGLSGSGWPSRGCASALVVMWWRERAWAMADGGVSQLHIRARIDPHMRRVVFVRAFMLPVCPGSYAPRIRGPHNEHL